MKELWKKWCEEGLRWPYLHDPVSKKPSVTLMFLYITFMIMVMSLILLHFFNSLLIATGTSIVAWALATVFYMIRKVTKAKFDLTEKSFELENNSESAPAASPTPEDLTSS